MTLEMKLLRELSQSAARAQRMNHLNDIRKDSYSTSPISEISVLIYRLENNLMDIHDLLIKFEDDDTCNASVQAMFDETVDMLDYVRTLSPGVDN